MRFTSHITVTEHDAWPADRRAPLRSNTPSDLCPWFNLRSVAMNSSTASIHGVAWSCLQYGPLEFALWSSSTISRSTRNPTIVGATSNLAYGRGHSYKCSGFSPMRSLQAADGQFAQKVWRWTRWLLTIEHIALPLAHGVTSCSSFTKHPGKFVCLPHMDSEIVYNFLAVSTN